MKQTGTEYWEVPYLPINPADINRQYEPIIRINSQSGKGGAAFVLEKAKGYRMPKYAQGHAAGIRRHRQSRGGCVR